MAKLVYSEQQNAMTSPITFGYTAQKGQIVVICSSQASNPTLTLQTPSSGAYINGATGTTNNTLYKGTLTSPNGFTWVVSNITVPFNSVTITNLTTSGSLIYAVFSGVEYGATPIRTFYNTAGALTGNGVTANGTAVSGSVAGDLVIGVTYGFNSGTTTVSGNTGGGSGSWKTVQKTTNSRWCGMGYYFNNTTVNGAYWSASSTTSGSAVMELLIKGSSTTNTSVTFGGTFSTLATTNSISLQLNATVGEPNSLSSGGVG
jgi:hypothetical protein